MPSQNEITINLQQNAETIKSLLGNSSDLQIREIYLPSINKKIAILFIEDIVDSIAVQQYILEPLMEYPMPASQLDQDLLSFMESSVLQVKTVVHVHSFTQALSELLAGKSIVMLEGLTSFLSADTPKWNTRGIESPKGQRIVKGPDAGFTEDRSINISLIRKIIKNPNLRISTQKFGTNTNTDVSVIYIENLVDKQVLNEINNRLSQVNLDAVLEGNYIEEVLTKESKSFFPLMLNTDRPDVAAAEMLEGKITILVDGTPYALIAPAVLIQFFQTPDDYYTIGKAMIDTRLVRIFLFILSLYIPGIFVAFTTFHANLLPVKLLIGFVSEREIVPIPTTVEIIVLYFVIVAINESSTRLPQNIAVTLSLFASIILGQSAVQAQLVEPVTLVVMSVSYIFNSLIPIATFRKPAASLTFGFIIIGSALGLYGIALASLILLLHLCSLRTFGVPYFSPFAPLVARDLRDSVVRSSIEKITNDESNFQSEEMMEQTNQEK